MTPHAAGRGSGLAFALLLLSAAGCGDRGDGGDLTLDGLPVLSLQPDLRLGSFDDPDAGFSRVGSMDVDDQGNLYVLEVQDREIRVFSPDGERLRTVGGPGEGPGEFAGSPWFGVQGDTLWTIDSQAERITLFGLDGGVLSTGRIEAPTVPLPRGFGYVYPRVMRADGTFSGQLSLVTFRRDQGDTGVEEGEAIPVPRVLFDATGAVVDTLGWDPHPPPRMVPPPGYESPFEVVEVAGGRYQVPTPPSELPMWSPLPDGRVELAVPLPTAASGAALTVTRVGLDGDTLYHREIRYVPEPYTDEDLEAIAGSAASRSPFGAPQSAEAPGDEAGPVIRALRDAMDFPAWRPAVQYAWVGPDRTVWLRRYDPRGETSRWVLLDADGLPRGEIRLGAGARVLWSGGDRFWAVEPDELDVPWLVRYRIVEE